MICRLWFELWALKEADAVKALCPFSSIPHVRSLLQPVQVEILTSIQVPRMNPCNHGYSFIHLNFGLAAIRVPASSVLLGPLWNVDCWLFYHILLVVVTIYYVKEQFTTLFILQGYVEGANQPPLSVCKHNLERTHNTFNRIWQTNRKVFSMMAQPILKTR